MLKKLIISACIAGIGLFVSCSNLNDSLTLGGQIITNSDPNRTDFNNNFEYFDTLQVTSQYSVAEPVDTTIGVGYPLVGKDSSKIVRGIYGFSHDTSVRFKNYRRILKKVAIEISADSIPRTIHIYSYHNQGITTPVNASVSTKLSTNNKFFKDSLNSATVASIDSTFRSYYALDTVADALSKKRTNKSHVLKLLVASDDSIFTLQKAPKLILTYDSSNVIIIDTLKSDYSSNVQFDVPEIKSAFDPIPVSSTHTGRYAVFKLDLSTLWADMSKRSGFTTILSVPIVISGQSLTTSDSSSQLDYRYYVSDKNFSNPNEFYDSIEKKGLQGTILAGQNLDTIAADIYFRNLSKNKPATAYLYLRNPLVYNTTSDRSIRWSNPIITGVFTNNQ